MFRRLQYRNLIQALDVKLNAHLLVVQVELCPTHADDSDARVHQADRNGGAVPGNLYVDMAAGQSKIEGEDTFLRRTVHVGGLAYDSFHFHPFTVIYSADHLF